MIRIIGGIYKGRFLEIPNSKVTRPTMDKVRQAIFNILSHKTENAIACDLFAGSGAMGLEALSRGAKKCYFVDKDKGTFFLMKGNVKALNVPQEQYELFCGDYRVFIKRSAGLKLDLLFLDPPYKMDINADIIKDMDSRDMFAPGAVIVSEQEKANKEIEGYSMKEYRYGAKHVAVYTKEE
jgi:16S rRNA (guanine(966)-N(2))-methyltransferase RsmD